jgi:hypothetical protein
MSESNETKPEVNEQQARQAARSNDEKARKDASQYGERNFIGNRRHNIGGVAASGALQLRRLGGTTFQSTIVGP